MQQRSSERNQAQNVSFLISVELFVVCRLEVFFFFYFELPYRYIADIDLATITDRMAVKKAVQSGNVEDAIEKVNDLNPEVSSFIDYYWL